MSNVLTKPNGISEEQLERWSHQGAITSSAATYEAISNALKPPSGELIGHSYEVYLQGSYANSTNIRGDSDVDIVIELKSTFAPDTSNLSVAEKNLFSASYSDSCYYQNNFRDDVTTVLRDKFGANNIDTSGSKSIKVLRGSNRLLADVVPCFEYRNYSAFQSLRNQRFDSGIKILTQNSLQTIINYPNQHRENGISKNSSTRTDGRYKQTVRMFKNARSYLVDNNWILKSEAPSYFVECLVYNVPDHFFYGSYRDRYLQIVQHLSDSDKTKFVTQSERQWLFGNASTQWNIETANKFLLQLSSLWLHW